MGPRCLIILILTACFCGSRQEAAAQWPYTTSKQHFAFHADFPLDPNQAILEELVAIETTLCDRLGLPKSDERIDVYLFADRVIYESYMKRYFPDVIPRRAMFIKSNSPGNVFAYISPEFDVDLRHESTHALLHKRLPMVPLWLDEGLAEYFEVPAPDRERGNPYLATTRRRLHWQRPPPLEQLESFTRISQMGPEEYRHAWSWVHFMLHGPPDAQQALQDYFASILRHEPPPPLSVLLSQRLPDPDKAYVDHFRIHQASRARTQ